MAPLLPEMPGPPEPLPRAPPRPPKTGRAAVFGRLWYLYAIFLIEFPECSFSFLLLLRMGGRFPCPLCIVFHEASLMVGVATLCLATRTPTQ